MMTIPITPRPREAAQYLLQPEEVPHRRLPGGPIGPQQTPTEGIAVKDPALSRPVPNKTDSAKFGLNSSGGLLFRDNNPASASPNFDSLESPTLFSNPTLVSNTVSSQALFGNMLPTHNISSTATSSASPATHKMDFNGSPGSLNPVSGTLTSVINNPSNATSDPDAMKNIFQDYLVDDFADDSSYLFTPHTTATSFTGNSVFTSGHDTPSISLAEIDHFLSSTNPATIGDQDFNLFGDYKIHTDEWNSDPLFSSTHEVAEDPLITPYAFFKETAATVITASPHQFSLSTIGTEVEQVAVPSPKKSVKLEPTLPSPEPSPRTSRKVSNTRRQATKAAAARRVSGANSNTPFTPITPAPTTPSTPQAVVSFCTKRRIPVVDEDPAVVEKRRRNTIAAQRSRARKAEEKLEDQRMIANLERETENLRILLSYWKDRACALGASPMEDAEN